MSPAKDRASSAFALWTTVKIVAALIVMFLLVGVAIPNLVDAHNTLMLLAAIVLGFFAIAVAIWTLISIRRSWRRLRRGVIHLIEG